MQHETIAETIVREIANSPIPLAQVIARQGDVMFRRISEEPTDALHGPTPAGGCVIAAGKHGEHRLLGAAVAWLPDGTVSIRGTAVLVHTDVPAERHGAICFDTGTWQYHGAQELGVDQVVRKVED